MKLLNFGHDQFRNLNPSRLTLEGKRHFFLGKNGQGKSNLLEGLGYLGSLRSFRTHETRPLLRTGSREARLLYELGDEDGEHRVEITLRPGTKRLLVNGDPVKRLSLMIGRFPSITMHSGDLALLDGSPGNRRRFLDLHLSFLSPDYLKALKDYQDALSERNALLKTRKLDAGQLSVFEEPMARAGEYLVDARGRGLKALEGQLVEAYGRISPVEECPRLRYRPDVGEASREGFANHLKEQRSRDALQGTTRQGPHRDDFVFELEGGEARMFASEGQKRGMVVALRMAQLRMLREGLGRRPLLFADDIIGELDPERRERFWASFDPEIQLFATGTEPPFADPLGWQIFSVEAGRVTLRTGNHQDA